MKKAGRWVSFGKTAQFGKKDSRMKKSTIAIIAVSVIMLIMLLAFIGSEKKPTLFTGSLSELLPTRKDISTEWIMKEPSNVTVNATGILDGIQQVFKTSGLEATGVVVTIYRFDSIASADNYYNSVVDEVKQKGGYKEVKTNSLGITSYGTYVSRVSGDVTMIYGVKSNIFIKVQASSLFSTSTQDDAIQFGKIVVNKLVNKLGG